MHPGSMAQKMGSKKQTGSSELVVSNIDRSKMQ